MSERWSRRDVLRAGLAGAGGIAWAALASRFPSIGVAAEAPRRPNILLIVADDLGYADLSCFDALDGKVDSRIRTSNLDRLAGEGAMFTSFYAGNGVCTPSRAGLLTGRYACRSGANVIYRPDSTDGMRLGEVTIAEQLRAAGYATACIGKWHLGIGSQGINGLRNNPPRDEYMPTRRGFDRYFGVPYSNDQADVKGAPPLALVENSSILEGGPGAARGTDQELLTERYTDEAIKFIRAARERQQPFFVYLPYTMPHVPVHASKRFQGVSAYEGGPYGDAVEEIDYHVGRLMGELAQLGIERETLILFTSDNGPWLTAWNPPPPGHRGFALPYRDGKGTVYEGGYRVPFIARWTGRIGAGRRVDDPAHFHDLFPTLCTLGGAARPAGVTLDGEDLTELLLGTGQRAGGPEEFRFFYYECGRRSRQILAYRRGQWKLHVNRDDQPVELYDLSEPGGAGEQNNRVKETSLADLVETMRGELVSFEQSVE